MPELHKKFGGSTVTRTLNCPGWVNLSEQVPKMDRSSTAADRGTLLHSFMEDIYSRGVEPTESSGIDPGTDTDLPFASLPETDQDAVVTAYEATEAVLDDIGATELLLEKMVQLGDNADVGGSADMIAIGDSVAVVLDYKFGFVPVTETEQFEFYALCALETPGVRELLAGKAVESAIIQPAVSAHAIRAGHTPEELDYLYERLMDAIDQADSGANAGNPGSWCKYCPAAVAHCPAKRQQVAGFLAYDPKVPQQLSGAMSLVGQMKDQIKAIEAETFDALENGVPVPGWKLVPKQAIRRWSKPAEALDMLTKARKITKQLYTAESLVSPTQLEKACKKAGVEIPQRVLDLVTRESSGTTLAPESDKREPVSSARVGVPDALKKVLEGTA